MNLLRELVMLSSHDFNGLNCPKYIYSANCCLCCEKAFDDHCYPYHSTGVLPSAVWKRNSSPSLQKTSHTRQATSRGSDLLNSRKILATHRTAVTSAVNNTTSTSTNQSGQLTKPYQDQQSKTISFFLSWRLIIIAQSTAQGHLRAFHKLKSRTSLQ